MTSFDKQIIFIHGKLRFLKITGRTLSIFCYILDNEIAYNSNIICLSSETIKNMCTKINIPKNTFSSYLTLLCEAGIFARIGRSKYIYNPHIFYYADEEVAQEMQKKFACVFDEERLKIEIDLLTPLNHKKLLE